MQKHALNNAATAYNAGNYQCYPCSFFDTIFLEKIFCETVVCIRVGNGQKRR